jgi:hypothetical protein
MSQDIPRRGALHHVELWVPDLPRAALEWGWLLGELGYAVFQDWPQGRSWRLGATYIVIEQSPPDGGCARPAAARPQPPAFPHTIVTAWTHLPARHPATAGRRSSPRSTRTRAALTTMPRI